MSVPETLTSETCERAVAGEKARRTETRGDLDAEKWQTLSRPHYGNRLKTVFVSIE